MSRRVALWASSSIPPRRPNHWHNVAALSWAAADGSNNQQIAAELKIPPITVGEWRRSFAIHGLDGLHDAARSGRPPKHDSDTRHKVQTRVCQQPENQSRWTVRMLAAEVGLPASTVHAMLVAAKLQPHRIRTFTFSPDPDFEAKLLDIVGLYLNPPESALCCVWTRKRAFSMKDYCVARFASRGRGSRWQANPAHGQV